MFFFHAVLALALKNLIDYIVWNSKLLSQSHYERDIEVKSKFIHKFNQNKKYNTSVDDGASFVFAMKLFLEGKDSTI